MSKVSSFMYRYLIFLILSFALCANTIFINAKIYTVNPQKPWAQAIVIDEGLIKYVGTNRQALSYKNSNTKIVDAKSKFMMPGIIDAHTHIGIGSILLEQGVNLLRSKGKKQIFSTIKEYAKSSDEKIITGFGFYPYVLGQKGPTKEQLDHLVPNRPAFLISNNGHSAWVNSKALTLLGLSSKTKDPLPGMHYYERNAKGEPTGFLVEGEAFWPHLKKIGIGKQSAFYKGLKNFLPKLSKQGITTIFDAGIPAVEENAYKALIQLEKEKKLPLRFFASHYIINEYDAQNAAKTFKKYQNQYNQNLFSLSTVKFSNDNSDDDQFAIQFQEKKLSNFLLPLLKEGIDIMIHTSHDSSVHQALNAIEKNRSYLFKKQSRVTLAHVNMVRDSDFKRFQKLNIIANIQPFNAKGGGYYEYRYLLYEDWEDKLVRFKTFFDTKTMVSASSDFPACNSSLEKCSPYESMQIAITRQNPVLGIKSPILPNLDERLNIKQIIQAYTINAAYQLHQEKNIGSLEIGKKADLILLDQDLLSSDSYDIHKSKVLLTMVNGEIVYEIKK